MDINEMDFNVPFEAGALLAAAPILLRHTNLVALIKANYKCEAKLSTASTPTTTSMVPGATPTPAEPALTGFLDGLDLGPKHLQRRNLISAFKTAMMASSTPQS
jgi:hypothetical protein